MSRNKVFSSQRQNGNRVIRMPVGKAGNSSVTAGSHKASDRVLCSGTVKEIVQQFASGKQPDPVGVAGKWKAVDR